LKVYEDIERETETCVRGFKMLVSGAGFVHLDDDETRSQSRCAKDMEEEVSEGARALLFGGMGWLEDKGGLDGEEETGLFGVSELLREENS
jgi:hypothetical protein